MKTFERLGGWGVGSQSEESTPTLPHAPLLALFLALVLGLTTPGCAYYSFTGASIPQRLSTISVPLAVDNSVSPINTLDQDLTEQLVNRFVDQTRLSLETNEGAADATLTLRIESYENRPTSVGANERATLNRVTLRVNAVYYDQVEDQELLSRTFSSFEEYEPIEGISGERAAAEAALENIAEDIFTAATSNW